jgi:hypothetical protein
MHVETADPDVGQHAIIEMTQRRDLPPVAQSAHKLPGRPDRCEKDVCQLGGAQHIFEWSNIHGSLPGEHDDGVMMSRAY